MLCAIENRKCMSTNVIKSQRQMLGEPMTQNETKIYIPVVYVCTCSFTCIKTSSNFTGKSIENANVMH